MNQQKQADVMEKIIEFEMMIDQAEQEEKQRIERNWTATRTGGGELDRHG